MVTNDLKLRILDGIKERRCNYASNAKMATFLGISAAQYSRVMKGELDSVLGDGNWISIARKLEIVLSESMKWDAVETQVFQYINVQLTVMQKMSVSGILCDLAGIGKTFAARYYVKGHKNAVYIDCSQCKSKQRLIRAISKGFGVPNVGKYEDVKDNLKYWIGGLPTPLVVLDEAGDLDYPAFLELKELFNATENLCSWYLMGAEGLRDKINRMLVSKKIGYSEMVSRLIDNNKKIVPDGTEASMIFLRTQVAAVAAANGVANTDKFAKESNGSLRWAYKEIKKMKYFSRDTN